MKTFGKIVGTIALICLVAFASCGCDSDQDIPGNSSSDIVGDHNPGDEPDTTDPPGDAWEDDSEGDVEEVDAGLTLNEFCGQFVGLWDCTVVEGYNVGFFAILLIETLDVLEYQHTLWVEYVNPTGSKGTIVCRGVSPAETGAGGYFYLPEHNDDTLTIEHTDQINPKYSFTMECTPHPTD